MRIGLKVCEEYFCDRIQESERLVREVLNGNNLALVSYVEWFNSLSVQY
ncbi:hypothetical protein [uncultured Bacteroides sp.]|nr:hypothetical protein [uncultured Bacteroides sp.]